MENETPLGQGPLVGGEVRKAKGHDPWWDHDLSTTVGPPRAPAIGKRFSHEGFGVKGGAFPTNSLGNLFVK